MPGRLGINATIMRQWRPQLSATASRLRIFQHATDAMSLKTHGRTDAL